MTVNELLLELMRLTLEGKGDYKISAKLGYEWEDISKVCAIDDYKAAILEV